MLTVGPRNAFCRSVAMRPGLVIALRFGLLILRLWPDILKLGRITPDVIVSMGVTDFAAFGIKVVILMTIYARVTTYSGRCGL